MLTKKGLELYNIYIFIFSSLKSTPNLSFLKKITSSSMKSRWRFYGCPRIIFFISSFLTSFYLPFFLLFKMAFMIKNNFANFKLVNWSIVQYYRQDGALYNQVHNSHYLCEECHRKGTFSCSEREF